MCQCVPLLGIIWADTQFILESIWMIYKLLRLLVAIYNHVTNSVRVAEESKIRCKHFLFNQSREKKVSLKVH